MLFWTAADLEGNLVEFQQYYNEHRTCGAGRAPAGAEPGRHLGESPGVSVAAALSWPVLHAEGRVTQLSRSALTRTIYEFATHTRKGIARQTNFLAPFSIRYEDRGPAVSVEAKKVRTRKMISELRTVGY